MDSARFDRLARTLSSRRAAISGLVGGALLSALTPSLDRPNAAAALKKCAKGTKRCGNRCIAKRKCCTNANCRPKGSGKICQNGTCQCPRQREFCGGTCCATGQICIGGACWPDAEEAAFISLINQHRSTNGQAALKRQNQLATAAELHSRDQAVNQFSSHTGSDGSSPSERLVRAGYDYSRWGENIYYGGGTAAAAFAWWRQSPPHNSNMLSPNFTQLGIARAQSTTGVWYWTTTFGDPQ